MTDLRLSFGLNTDTIPADARAVWGARLIWPNDLVWDRTSHAVTDEETAALSDLMDWLNDGRLRVALDRARELADTWELRPSENREVVLYGHENTEGMIVANPRASHGYLYVAAWLHV